ncbi:Putative uncharacterized protein [Moritella viscosa]|nr:Putative uncharacterized protein [Moritella viscosa]
MRHLQENMKFNCAFNNPLLRNSNRYNCPIHPPKPVAYRP